MRKTRANNFSWLMLFLSFVALVGCTSLIMAVEARQRIIAGFATNDPDSVEARLNQLFTICKNGEAEKAASYFVYRGADKARKWKDTLRASDPIEKAAAEEGCLRINSYRDKDQKYSFGKVQIEKEEEGEWHVLEVSFSEDSETKKVIFAFLLVNGQFAIGDIDN